MASRPRLRGTVKAKLSLDKTSYDNFKQQLKLLERAARKEVIEEALMAGGSIIHSAAQSRAPGPIEIVIVGGRTLRKRVDPKFAAVVKSNAKLVAIGPSAKKWWYRFFEFGATPHDIRPLRGTGVIAFPGDDGMVFARFAKRTGGVTMRPFLRPAVDQNKDAAVNAMGTVLAREIKKAARG